MSEHQGEGGDKENNVVQLNVDKVKQAVDNPKRRGRKPKDAGPPKPRPPAAPAMLPPDCPVRCLGREGMMYYFIDTQDHFIALPVKDVQRLPITALFNGQDYLIKNFPSYDKHGELQRHKWDHNAVANALIVTCQAMGTWNPKEKIRGVGCWREDDVLVIHCGDILATSRGRAGIGLRGKFLYPAAPPLPEPIRGVAASDGADFATGMWGPDEWATVEGPGARIMQVLVTWNMARPFIDPILIMGEIGCCMLGAALEWRPMMCVTGDSRTGKSSLLDGIKAIIGPDAYISSGNATRAAIAALIGNTTKPVILDEFERGDDDKVHAAITQFMTLSSSGETLDRGTSGHETHTFQARNCFILSAINLPSLRPQELNRVFVIDLQELAHPVLGDPDPKDGVERHKVWGSLKQLTEYGCQIRGRLLDQWPRWKDTLRAYQAALCELGHDRRAADQFGTALCAYDLMMFSQFSQKRVQLLTQWLPAKKTSETADQKSQGEQCLDFLMEQLVGVTRGGAQKMISSWIGEARANYGSGDKECREVLAQNGIVVGMLGQLVKGLGDPNAWYIAIAVAHSGVAHHLDGTPWHKKAGGTSGYVDVLKRLPGALTLTAGGERIRIRLVPRGPRTYVVLIPYDTVIPDGDD